MLVSKVKVKTLTIPSQHILPQWTHSVEKGGRHLSSFRGSLWILHITRAHRPTQSLLFWWVKAHAVPKIPILSHDRILGCWCGTGWHYTPRAVQRGTVTTTAVGLGESSVLHQSPGELTLKYGSCRGSDRATFQVGFNDLLPQLVSSETFQPAQDSIHASASTWSEKIQHLENRNWYESRDRSITWQKPHVSCW